MGIPRPAKTMTLLIRRGHTGYGPGLYFSEEALYNENMFIEEARRLRRALVVLNEQYKIDYNQSLFCGNEALDDDGTLPSFQVDTILMMEAKK